MKQLPLSSIILVCACSILSCTTPTKPPVAKSPVPSAAKGPLVDNTQVPAPKNLVLVGRIRSFHEWLQLTARTPAVQWLEDQVAKDSPLLKDLDFTQPVELAVVYDPSFVSTKAPAPSKEQEDTESETTNTVPDLVEHYLGAISIPLTAFSPHAYRQLGYEPRANGTYAKGDCLVSPALGSAKARLICSSEPEAAQRMQPYMTRGLPLEHLSKSPLFLELRPEPWKGVWEPARDSMKATLHGLAEMNSPSASLAKQLGLSVLDEAGAWVRAIDTLRVEAGPTGNGEFEATARLTTKHPNPWLLDGYLATAAQVKGAPEPYLDLPSDANSIGYQYGLPAERLAVLQSALLSLANTAQNEFGPLSKHLDKLLKPAQAKALDGIVQTWIAALDSPCLRADYVTWANSGSQIRAAGKQPVTVDRFLAAFLGQSVAATPQKAHCPAEFARLLESLRIGYELLPKAAQREMPLRFTKPKTVKTPGLPPVTLYRLTVDKKVLDEALGKMPSSTDSSVFRYAPAKASAVFTLMVVSQADVDWFAFGLEEKALFELLNQVLHPKGPTLRTSAELAPLLQSKPIALSTDHLGYSLFFTDLLGSDTESMRAVTELLRNAALTSRFQVSPKPGGSELTFSYRLPASTMNAVREMLSWDVARLQDLAKQLDERLKPPATPTEAEPSP